jgi:hypothetical protein
VSLISQPLAYARGTVSVHRKSKEKSINVFIRQKNGGRNIRNGGFDTVALRFGAIAARARFSEREKPLRLEMRGLPRE